MLVDDCDVDLLVEPGASVELLVPFWFILLLRPGVTVVVLVVVVVATGAATGGRIGGRGAFGVFADEDVAPGEVGGAIMMPMELSSSTVRGCRVGDGDPISLPKAGLPGRNCSICISSGFLSKTSW